MPPVATDHRARVAIDLTDEADRAWHPAAISDRKLRQLHQQLVKVQALGGAFADVSFSPAATDRLRQIQSRGET